MSGPKVVRVVTREERMAPALKLLHSLRGAVARCHEQTDEVFAERHVPAFRQRLRNLASAVQAANKFKDLEKAIRAEIAYIQGKQEEYRQILTKKRSRERLGAYSAVYRKALREQEERQFRLHAQAQEAPALTEEQKKIVEEIRNYPDGEAVKIWDAAEAALPETVTRLERSLAELEILHAPSAQTFAARLADIQARPPGQKRDMLRDGLLLELAAAVKEQRELAAALAELEDLASQRDLGAEVAAEVKRTAEARSLGAIRRLSLQIAASLKQTEEKEFAALRREAILKGLAELGYAPGEEMDTLVEDRGRLILRPEARSAYGIEITGASAPRMQARVVSFSGNSDPKADYAAESKWCAQLAALRERAKQYGSEIIIDMARKAGEVEMKRVSSERPATAKPQYGTFHR